MIELLSWSISNLLECFKAMGYDEQTARTATAWLLGLAGLTDIWIALEIFC